MSWAATAYVKRLTHGSNGQPLDRTEKLVLYGIADYYNDEAMAAWPSATRLAEECLISRRSLFRVIERLETKGILRVTRSKGEDRRHQVNVYRFCGLHPEELAVPRKPDGRGARSRRGDAESPPIQKDGSDFKTLPARQPSARAESPRSSEGGSGSGTPPAHLSGDRRVTRGGDSMESLGVVTQWSHQNLHTTAIENHHSPPAAAVRSTSRGRGAAAGGALSLSLPEDDLATAMVKINGGRAPSIPEATAEFLSQHGQFARAGIDGPRLRWLHGRLLRAHPGWCVNTATILRHGHTVLPPEAAAPSQEAPAPPAVEVGPPPVAEREAARRAREQLESCGLFGRRPKPPPPSVGPPPGGWPPGSDFSRWRRAALARLAAEGPSG